MYGMILLGAVILICAICAGISALRGFSKSLVRVITVLLSAVAAVVTCFVLKSSLPTPEEFLLLVENNLGTIAQNFGADAVTTVEQIMEYATLSPTLIEFAIQLVGALLVPILCVLLFFLYSLLTLLIHLVVTLVLRRPLKEFNQKIPMSRLCAAGVGLVQGLIIVSILFIPVSGYLDVADTAVDAMVEQNVLEKDDPTIQTVQTIVNELDDAPVLTVYRTLGGNLTTSSLMKMEVADMDVYLDEEMDSIMVLAGHIVNLTKTPMSSYGEKEAEILRAIGDAFGDSKLITPIACDVLYAATEAWMNGEAFLGMEKPNMGESNEIFEPFLDALLEIIHDDCEIQQLLQGDVKTVAEMAAILSTHGVFAKIENPNELLTVLSGGEVVKSLVTELGKNRTMKLLIPEMTNLGVRAIGQVLSIPKNTEAVYDSFMSDVAGALNGLDQSADPQQIADLSKRLDTAFDEAGIVIDSEILDLYATSMVHDLVENNPSDVTTADVKAFFLLYADQVADPSTNETVSRPSYDFLSNKTSKEEIDDEQNKDAFAGTVYANMTEEQRKSSAAVVLANICTDLSLLDGNDETFAEQAKAIVVNAFTDLLGEDHVALETVKNTEITQPVSTSSIQNTASMKSSEEMKKTSTVVTVEDLLVNSKAAAENITDATLESEADAIAAIFNTAGSLVDTLNGGQGNLDMSTMANSIGTILDSLNSTGSFGQDNTAKLFTAVLQSKTVRDTAGLDMKTATEMANKATEGGGNYSQTMGTVAGSLGIMDKLQKNEKITDEELVDFMKNLTPQSAGMFKVFVTGKRLASYGVPEQHSGIAAELVASTFDYMSREDLKDYDKEAKALNVVLQMAMAAKDSDEKKLFSSTDEAEDGRLPTAKTAVTRVLDSEALRYSFVDVITDGEKVTRFDPFGVGSKINHNTTEYIDCQNAIYEYRDTHPEVDDLVFEAAAAMFGVEVDFN